MSSEEESSMELMQDQNTNLVSNIKGCNNKKRTRQRVDAGEPRNSYASIANFTSRGGYNHIHSSYQQQNSTPTTTTTYNGLSLSPKFITDLKSSESVSKSEMIVLDDNMPIQMCVNGTLGVPTGTAPYINGGNMKSHNNGHSELDFNKNKNNINYQSSKGSDSISANSVSVGASNTVSTAAHLLRDILQTGRKFEHPIVDSDQPNSSGNNKVGGLSQCSDASEIDEIDEEEDLTRDREANRDIAMDQDQDPSELREDRSPSVTGEPGSDNDNENDNEIENEQLKSASSSTRSPSPSSPKETVTNSCSNSNSTIAEVKRARVENIVSNMLQVTGGNGSLNSSTSATTAKVNNNNDNNVPVVPVNGCKKRKLYQPQQTSKLNGPTNENDEFDDEVDDELVEGDEVDEEDIGEDVSELDLSPSNTKRAKQSVGEKSNLHRQLFDLQEQIVAMRQRYFQLFDEKQPNQTTTNQQAVAAASLGSSHHSINMSQLGSPVNLTTSISPHQMIHNDECDTELDETISEKGPTTPGSQLSESLTNRDTPKGNVLSSSNQININDPAQFLDEARRLISEQEKMTKKTLSSIEIRQSRHPMAHNLQPSLHDLDWLIESLKGELQASVMQIIDSVFAKFIQRKATQQKLNFHLNQLTNDQNVESSKELTLLSQMLDRKSPRTKVVDRGAGAGAGAGVAAAAAAALSSSFVAKNLNGPSARGSPISLPTETAQAPKPTPTFPFPHPNFKSPFLFPSVAPSGAQIPHQPALIPTATALAQHFNTIASTLNAQHQAQANAQAQHHREQLNSFNSRENNSSSNRDNLVNNRENNSNNNGNSTNGLGHTQGHVSSGGNVFGSMHSSASNRNDDSLPEQTEAMSLVIAPKRKRHKVTDTRITPRTINKLLQGQENLLYGGGNSRESPISPPGSGYHPMAGAPPPPPPPLVPVSLPTSVAIPNPSLLNHHQSELFSGSTFPFGDPHTTRSFFGDINEDNDLKDSKDRLHHNAVASAVAQAAAAHHLQNLLAASQRHANASPDGSPIGPHGFPGLGYNRGGSDGGDGSETNETQSMYDSTMPMISFSFDFIDLI